MTITRERAREILSTHSIGVEDMACRRCGRKYGLIVEEELPCDAPGPDPTEAIDERKRPGTRSRGTWAETRGYTDPKRPGLAWIRAVCEPELRRMLIAAAETEGVTLSEVVRRACRRYVGLD